MTNHQMDEMRLLIGVAALALVALTAAESFGQQFSLSSDPETRNEEVVGIASSLRVDGSVGSVRYTIAGEDVVSFIDGSVVRRHRVEGKIVGTSESLSGRFAAILVLSEGAPERAPGLRLELFDTDAGSLYRIPLQYDTDEPFPSLSVTDGGSVAAIHHAAGKIVFLSPSGEDIVNYGLAAGGYDIERSMLISRASISGNVAVAVNEPAADGVRSVTAAQVYLFTPSGQRVGMFDIPPLTMSALAVSGDGTRFAVGGYDIPTNVFRTAFYDDSGREQYRTDFAAEAIEFDASGDRVMIADKRRFAIVQPDVARTIVEHRLPTSSDRILATAFSEEGRFAAVLTGTTNFSDGRFLHDGLKLIEVVIGPEGNHASQVRLLAESVEAVRLDVEAFGIALSLDDKLLVFRRRQ